MSNFSDQTLQCVECGKDFKFSAKDQVFFEQQRWTPPKRCHDCRRASRERKKAAHAR